MTWVKCKKCKRDAYPNELHPESGLCRDCFTSIALTHGQIQQCKREQARKSAWKDFQWGEGYER